jgi:hypothetical protein
VRFGFQLLCFLFIIPWQAFSQYTNEWVRPGQDYYRIPIAKKGIYKLTYSDLQDAGVPVATIDPRLIQLFHRGKEQAIFVKGQSDAVLNTDDYIEFFGQANDGTLDKALYKPSTSQPHNYYNLFSDTTAYFLTWSTGAVAGKRVTTFDEVNVTNIPKEISHYEERLLINNAQYSGGATFSFLEPFQYTHFDLGEGWTGISIRPGDPIDYTIDLVNNTEVAAGNPQLELLLVGRDHGAHGAEILVGPSAGSLRSLAIQNFNDFDAIKITLPINWGDIGIDGKLFVRLSAPTTINNRYQFSASYLKLIFPQNFQSSGLTEKVFYLKANPSGKSYVEWVNAPSGMRVWDITDPASIVSIGTRISGTSFTALVGSAEIPRTLHAFTSTRTPALKRVSFRLIDPAQSDYIIISNQLLMQPASSYNDPVKAYAGYRASIQGGSYDTLVVTMDQLYNQFNYGETSPVAIYEFMRFMVGKGQPKYLFLIGKGRDVNAGFHRLINPGPGVLKDLVPSAGLPGSDMNFTSGLSGTTYEPAVPTGRLSVTTPTEVANYLNKIKEIENPDLVQEWQKRGLHLSGGIQSVELPTFRSYLDGFKSTAEGIYWGSSISTIAKREPSQSELINISDEINEGVNLVTFFGHSSPGTIDIDIGKVTDPALGYSNAGKYPVFLINGCNAGSFFLNGELFGENWINAANLGARNFIAHSSYGLVSTLRTYSDYFYRIGFADSVFINKGVGDVQKEVAKQYMKATSPAMTNITQVQQMVLLGDPAVRLLQQTEPDYEITNSSLSLISFDGKTITSLTDSFAIRIVVRNLGVVKNKPVKIKVTRTFRDGSTTAYDSTFAPMLYQDTLLFKIYRGMEDGSGDNTFFVEIDPDNKIKELNEENNQATLSKSISSSSTLNLFPIAYGIENKTSMKFIWQSSDPLSAKRDYKVEVDTTVTFNSPFIIRRVVSGKVLADTTIELLNQDSTVYYWRTRFDNPDDSESKDWSVSSFSYIKNSEEGWAQLRKDQTRENFFSGLISDGDGNPFRFEEAKTLVEIKTFGINNPLPVTDVSVKINGSEYNLATQGQPCRNNTLNLIAFNKTTAVPYAGIPFNFQDPRTCGREPQLINSFAASELETGLVDDLTAFVNNVGVSDSVVLFSIGDPGYLSWSSSVKAKLGELGIGLSELNALEQGEPVIIFGKKGASPGSAHVFRSSLSPANEQLIFVAKEITGRKTEGTMKSVKIGPARSWDRFISPTPTVEASDQVSFLIYGVDNNGDETLIADNTGNEFDLSTISPEQFPHLKLVYDAKDEINLTPADWKSWILLYEPVAEGVLFYDGNVHTQNVQEGQSWSTRFGFTNVSKKDFTGPLNVELEVVTQETQHRLRKDSLIAAPLPGQTTFFNVYSKTVGKAGINDVNVYINRRDVPEQYYNNNFANLPGYLMVQPDKTNPVLEVTIDGREIRNGDFVSAKPLIQMTLKDENTFRLKEDTLGVKIFLSYPCETDDCAFKPIYFSDSSIKWYPSTTTSDFLVDFTPTNLLDGKYVLSVEATDASGNSSGADPYEISFNVKSETTLTFNGVYPNPSSVGFFFNFELSGNALPEEFLLEVFSPTGQLVTRFGIEDVQKFYIGTNEIIWNGEDATGKTLTNGVYFYRLRIKSGEIDTINTGKLVWIR